MQKKNANLQSQIKNTRNTKHGHSQINKYKKKDKNNEKTQLKSSIRNQKSRKTIGNFLDFPEYFFFICA